MRREVQKTFQLYPDSYNTLFKNPGTLQDRELAINTSEFTNDMLDVYGDNEQVPSSNPRNDWRRFLLCMRFSVATSEPATAGGLRGYQATRMIPTLEFLRYNGGLPNGDNGRLFSGAKQIGYNPIILQRSNITNEMTVDNVQDAIDSMATKLSAMRNVNQILNIADTDKDVSNHGTAGTIASITWAANVGTFTNKISSAPMRSALFGNRNEIFGGANIVTMGERNYTSNIQNSAVLGSDNILTGCTQSVLFGAGNTMNSIANSIVGGSNNTIEPGAGTMLALLASDNIKVASRGNSQYFAALSSSILEFAGFTPLTNNPNSLVAINTRFLNGATSGSPVAGNLANITVIGGQSHSIYNTLPIFIENSVLLGGNNLLPVDNAAVVRNLVIQGGALMLGNPNDSAYAAPSLGSLLVSGSATQLNTPTGMKDAATIGWRKGANDTALFYRNDDLMFGALPMEAGGTGNTSGEAKPIGDAGGDLTGYYPNPIIRDSAVSNAKMSNMPKWTIKGNGGNDYFPPQDLSVDETKALLVLDKVDNTSDAEKIISDATQAALDSEAAARQAADTALQTAIYDKAPANASLSADTGTGTDITTPAVQSATVASILQTIWAKIRQVANVANGKQNALTAGANIQISGSTISATNTVPNDATLTIQKNGANVATFTANASSNATANITVPTTDNTAPSALASGGTGSPGSSDLYARRDHSHTLPAYPDVSGKMDKPNGTASQLVRGDGTLTQNGYVASKIDTRNATSDPGSSNYSVNPDYDNILFYTTRNGNFRGYAFNATSTNTAEKLVNGMIRTFAAAHTGTTPIASDILNDDEWLIFYRAALYYSSTAARQAYRWTKAMIYYNNTTYVPSYFGVNLVFCFRNAWQGQGNSAPMWAETCG